MADEVSAGGSGTCGGSVLVPLNIIVAPESAKSPSSTGVGAGALEVEVLLDHLLEHGGFLDDLGGVERLGLEDALRLRHERRLEAAGVGDAAAAIGGTGVGAAPAARAAPRAACSTAGRTP